MSYNRIYCATFFNDLCSAQTPVSLHWLLVIYHADLEMIYVVCTAFRALVALKQPQIFGEAACSLLGSNPFKQTARVSENN